MSAYMLVKAQLLTQPVGGRSQYGTEVAKLIPEFGGRYLVRGRPVLELEGEWLQRESVVISEWPDISSIRQFWFSERYQKDLKPLRSDMGLFDVAVFEGE